MSGMEPQRVERKLAAIFAADVQGYSRLMGADEVGTLHTLTAYRQVTDTLIQHHRGRVVGSAGDSVLAEFASMVDAVQCVVEIQRDLRACLKSGRELSLRGAASNEAISFSSKDCFAPLAMTRYPDFSDSLLEKSFTSPVSSAPSG